MSMSKCHSAAGTGQRQLQAGPLGGEMGGFSAWLSEQGYSRSRCRRKLHLAGVLSRWLDARGLGLPSLDEARLQAFLEDTGRGPNGGAAAGRQLLEFLRGTGRLAPARAEPGPDDPAQGIRDRYERFLVDDCGLAPLTVKRGRFKRRVLAAGPLPMTMSSTKSSMAG